MQACPTVAVGLELTQTLFWQVWLFPHVPQATFAQPLKMVPQFSPWAAQLVVGLHTQSLSTCAVHPAGQHPSPPWHDAIFVWAHWAEQVAAAPVKVSVVQATLSLHEVGQFPSQVSAASTIPSPQVEEQSLSFADVHPLGQHPSLFVQAVRAVFVHWKEHVSTVPVNPSVVQALPSSHEVGQLPSQASPVSTTPLPQVFEQSASLAAEHPSEQQSSAVMEHATGDVMQRAVQPSGSPAKTDMKHMGASSQVSGQAPSPDSIR